MKTLIWKALCSSEHSLQLLSYGSNLYKSLMYICIYIYTYTYMCVCVRVCVSHICNRILPSHIKEWNFALCSNMDEPGGYSAKWDKSNREKQIPYDFTYMWKLKNKTKEQTEQNRNRLIDTENKLVVARGGWAGAEGQTKQVNRIIGCKLPAIK